MNYRLMNVKLEDVLKRVGSHLKSAKPGVSYEMEELTRDYEGVSHVDNVMGKYYRLVEVCSQFNLFDIINFSKFNKQERSAFIKDAINCRIQTALRVERENYLMYWKSEVGK